jgi:hypothetical protein
MPLRKYRSIEEMPKPPRGRPFDPGNLAHALSLSELCYRLRPWRFPRGVHKHRSIEQANLQRKEWEVAAVRSKAR